MGLLNCKTPAGITASASEKDGIITLTLSNLSPDTAEEVTVDLKAAVKDAKGRILQGRVDAYNDFDSAPLQVEDFSDFRVIDDGLLVKMPACSVAEIRFGS